MHWIESIPLIAAGFFAWLITTNTFPGTPQMRDRLRIAAPWTQNKLLMRYLAVFFWLFGGAILLKLLD